MDFYLYKISIRVRDSQGRTCLQPYVIPLQACRCDSRNYCSSGATKIVIIGGGGAGGGGAGGGGAGGGAGGAGGAGGGGTGGAGGGGAGGDGSQTGGGTGQDYVGTGYEGGGGSDSSTDSGTYTGGEFGNYDSYTGTSDYGRNEYPGGYALPASTTLSGSAIGLMFLGGLIFVCKYKIKKMVISTFLKVHVFIFQMTFLVSCLLLNSHG